MKILHVSYNFHPVTGGIEKHIEDLCRGLVELGHESEVCCIRIPGTAKEDVIKGIPTHRLRALNTRFYKIAPGVARIAKKYDIVHIHGLGFFSDFLALTKIFHGKRLVLSTHGGIFHTKNISALKWPYFNIWCRIVMGFLDAVVAVSKSDRALFSQIRQNICMIPNAIDFNHFSSTKRKPENGLLMFVGRLSHNKRVDNLIRAVAEMKIIGKNATLVVIGEDWEGQRTQLEGLAKSLGVIDSIIFAGKASRKNLMHYFERAQFFVSASEYEGFGISVLEAMATGLPVIVNKIDAFKTFVDNGKNGYMVDFNNPKNAAEDIIDIIESGDLDGISEGAKMTAREYDYKKTAKRIEALYQDISKTSS